MPGDDQVPKSVSSTTTSTTIGGLSVQEPTEQATPQTPPTPTPTPKGGGFCDNEEGGGGGCLAEVVALCERQNRLILAINLLLGTIIAVLVVGCLLAVGPFGNLASDVDDMKDKMHNTTGEIDDMTNTVHTLSKSVLDKLEYFNELLDDVLGQMGHLVNGTLVQFVDTARRINHDANMLCRAALLPKDRHRCCGTIQPCHYD
eukprot:TRINITY_DN1349_c0_g1_i1.p2 TRINITY_DN1349_c0_g1~~TRINITY_DN1349_c0_g1_i1.p2  ORF type:complete len:202 (+),score=45.58 TRINITY_DN1349_c0_g1_i1:187-792(+)